MTRMDCRWSCMNKGMDKMIFRKAEKEDFDKIRSLYWNLIDQDQDNPSFPHWKKGIHPSDEMIQNSIDREDVIENNTTAEKLYQKLGFRYIQTKTLYYDVVGEMTFKLYELVL